MVLADSIYIKSEEISFVAYLEEKSDDREQEQLKQDRNQHGCRFNDYIVFCQLKDEQRGP